MNNNDVIIPFNAFVIVSVYFLLFITVMTILYICNKPLEERIKYLVLVVSPTGFIENIAKIDKQPT